jgi:hypothetical protein
LRAIFVAAIGGQWPAFAGLILLPAPSICRDDMTRAERYRAKAEEIRTLGDEAETPALRTDLMAIAGQYDELARQADELESRPSRPLIIEPAKRDQTSTINYALSIERNTKLPTDDPAAYVIAVTPTFLPPRAMSQLNATARVTAARERWQGIARGLDDVSASITSCLNGAGLRPRLIVRSGVVWVRLERATGSKQR